MHFCCAERLCFDANIQRRLARPLSRAPNSPPSPPTFVQVRAGVALSVLGTLQDWLVLCRGEEKSKGRKLCSLTGTGRETEVLVVWGVPLWKVLALFKMCVFSIYLYIIHAAWMKKNVSDFPLCKPFLKNTICYFKSKKDWWQQLWNIICVSMNYLDQKQMFQGGRTYLFYFKSCCHHWV